MGGEEASRQSQGSEFGIPSLSPKVCGADSLAGSVTPLGREQRGSFSVGVCHSHLGGSDFTAGAPEFFPEHQPRQRVGSEQPRTNFKMPLRVMKFGGTSVGDAASIGRVVDIVLRGSRESTLVVVVSAMSGVTNKLIEAATRAEARDPDSVAAIFAELRKQHHAASSALISSTAERDAFNQKMEQVLQEGEHLCGDISLLGELHPRNLDFISSIGERVSAPLVASALREWGMACESVEATELVVTDVVHGGAEPLMEQSRHRCEVRLHPLLQQGIVPVITGFIGATLDGVLTTLGRGGSDYSATILGAALDAHEVVIWTDVDGVLTADPRLVPDACTIPEISYREATELAHFGAKVLHPKTLRPLMQSEIAVSIRNTFAPEGSGTKITPNPVSNGKSVKGLTAISDVTLITLGGSAIRNGSDVVGRVLSVAAATRADVLRVWHCSAENNLSFVVPSKLGKSTVEALRREFARDLAHEKVEHITVNPDVAIVTVVGHKMHSVSGMVGRTVEALGRENMNIIAIAQNSSECNICFVVAQNDVRAALVITHGAFQADMANSRGLLAKSY
jgi:aspartokinase/homoserine dehydrogenase 1